MSTDQENKDDVVMTDALQHRGRRKGRKHETFTLPSGEKVQIYYVNLDAVRDGYHEGVLKAFYAQHGGREFRSDAPTRIQPAIVEYLTKNKPAVFEDVIIAGLGSESVFESVRILHTNFIKAKYGIRGDGTPLLRNNEGFEKKYHPATYERIIPFTKERWARLKRMQKIVDDFASMLQLLTSKPAAKIAEILDGPPLFAGEETA
jgi:hypothetical protein